MESIPARIYDVFLLGMDFFLYATLGIRFHFVVCNKNICKLCKIRC